MQRWKAGKVKDLRAGDKAAKYRVICSVVDWILGRETQKRQCDVLCEAGDKNWDGDGRGSNGIETKKKCHRMRD